MKTAQTSFSFKTLFNLAKKYFSVFALSFLILNWLAFLPFTHVSIDELEYMANAERILNSDLKQSCGDEIVGRFETGLGYCVSKYNIGTSLFYLPSAVISKGFESLNVSSGASEVSSLSNVQESLGVFFESLPALLALLIGYFGFRKILNLQNISLVFANLYLLYPVFIYFSRTRFSEIFSAAIITWVLYFCLKIVKDKARNRDLFILGLLVVLGVSIRYTNAILLLILGLGVASYLFRKFYTADLKSSLEHTYKLSFSIKTTFKSLFNAIKSVRWLFYSLIPALSALLAFNQWLYGGIFRSGYYFSSEEGLYNFSQVPQLIILFILSLSILYPLMVLSLISYRKELRWAIISAVGLFIVFYAGFPYIFFKGELFDLILGIRFLVPATPLLLYVYADSLARLLNCSKIKNNFEIIIFGRKLIFQAQRYIKLFIILLITFSLLGVSVVSYYHLRFLQSAQIVEKNYDPNVK